MAIIKKPELFRFENHIDGLTKTVGNNRTVTHHKVVGAREIVGCLHGYPIFRLSQDYNDTDMMKLELSHCDWLTTTTRQAMTDFMNAAGIRGGVSFAGGKFSVRVNDGDGWVERESDDSPIRIKLTRAAIYA